jgi:hypothetical protein
MTGSDNRLIASYADFLRAKATVPSDPCICCDGTGYSRGQITYAHVGICPRCNKSGIEPDHPTVHNGLTLRNVRSGKVWVVYGSYPNDEWGIHRMKSSRRGGHYVWQIIVRPARQLLDDRRWRPIGFGDAWDHTLMESDPLREAA